LPALFAGFHEALSKESTVKSLMLVTAIWFLSVPPALATAQTAAGAPASTAPAQKKSKSQPGAADELKSKLPAENQDKADAFPAARKTASSKAKSNKGLEEAIRTAVSTDEFMLQSDKEYKLDKSVNLMEKFPGKNQIAVDYQVGSIDQKPAFVTVLVNSKDAPKGPEDAEKLFGAKLDGPVHLTGMESTMSACEGSRVCVETEKVGGQEVCVKWKCISK
jgi:hypothetical protein